MRVVLVRWIASSEYTDQQEQSFTDFHTVKVTTVGHLIYTDDAQLVVARDSGGDGVRNVSYRWVVSIPKNAIEGVEERTP